MMMLMIVEGTFFSRRVWVSGCGVAWSIYLPFKTIDARIVATTLLLPPPLLLPLLVAKDKKLKSMMIGHNQNFLNQKPRNVYINLFAQKSLLIFLWLLENAFFRKGFRPLLTTLAFSCWISIYFRLV